MVVRVDEDLHAADEQTRERDDARDDEREPHVAHALAQERVRDHEPALCARVERESERESQRERESRREKKGGGGRVKVGSSS